ncbi:MAG: fliR [Cyanobacteria bacterium RYN_339]|nr:fliR [Cyanobacteria bacterium RYN_339]
MDLNALLALPPNGLAIFLLVLCRASAIFLVAPVLGNANVPQRVKIGLAFMLALIFTPFLMTTPLTVDVTNGWALAVAVLQELSIGLVIGFLAQLVFVAFQFAGQAVGLQMGFGMANVFDPQSHAQVSVTAQFYLLVGVLVFLLIDGHHWLIVALEKSFTSVPLGTFHLDQRLFNVVLRASDDLFWTSLTLMAPVLGVLLLAEVGMGIVARIMPQMNVFVASFPVKVGLGVLTMALAFPLMVGYMSSLTEQSFALILKFLGA